MNIERGIVLNLKFPNIDTYHLIVFFYIANEKSITSAAEKLCLSQPTVSNHIKSLENALQTKLIEINRQRISLTPVGEGLYNYAKEIYTQALAAERFVEHMKTSTINIGISQFFLSAAKKAMKTMLAKWHSSVKLNFEFGTPPHLIQDVIDSKLDIAIMPRISHKDNRIIHIRISDGVKLVFFASPNHPIFQNRQTEWGDLCNYPIVISEDSASNQVISEKLISERVTTPLKFNLTTNNVELRKILVQDSNSISVALIEDVKTEIDSGTLKLLTLPGDIWMEVDAVLHRGTLTSAAVQDFISCIKTSF